MLKIEKTKRDKEEKLASVGNSNFYHIEVKSQREFKRFRVQDVSTDGCIECVGGQHADGTWDTVKWLVSKDLAHVEDGKLVADHADAQELFDRLEIVPIHLTGDRFTAKK